MKKRKLKQFIYDVCERLSENRDESIYTCQQFERSEYVQIYGRELFELRRVYGVDVFQVDTTSNVNETELFNMCGKELIDMRMTMMLLFYEWYTE